MIGDNIRYLRKRMKMSQGTLAERLGIRQSSVSLWESGSTTPETKYVMEMAKLFNVPADFIFSEERRRELDNISIRRGSVPIVGEIACGTPITAEQNIEGYADLPDGVRADFALRCKGDSMAPTFENNDLVLIRQQPDVEDGQIAAVDVACEATLKHVYHQRDGLLLVADNPKYPPILVTEEIIIHGLAVGYVRMFQR
jgi:repressor LexA